MLLKDFYNR